ncbi:flagellar motor protein [Methylobacillus caricis]|uniref:flagellar motor protein n=1 Tax=Methylobacillus caricis TaxID=1971611 RepID=UPI001CFFF703|nr:flagellar motor protein [Methylobacillus caricis]MCB5187980.1 flagellar motor protein [Methylobacillus caricis]
MDWSSLGGIALALGGILLGQALEGGKISSLIQPAAFMIVIFGTIGAVLLQTRPSHFIQGVRLAKWIIKPPEDDRVKLARRIGIWSQIARKDGVLLLENYMYSEQDPFIKKALRLLIDGTPPEKIRDICNVDINRYEASQRNAIKIWESAGGYAPTVGIMGAVLGLIHVMENLSDPSRLGSGIAVAFVATIYGVGFANLLFLPISNKLKALILVETTRREMLIEGIVSIAHSENSKVVEDRLASYLR